MPSAVRGCDYASAKLAYGPFGRSDFGELADASHALVRALVSCVCLSFYSALLDALRQAKASEL